MGGPAAGSGANRHMFKLLLQTRHEAAVRRRAFQLYHDHGIDRVMCALGAEIAKGGLAMRTDRVSQPRPLFHSNKRAHSVQKT